MSNKKPTMMQMKNVVSNMINQITMTQNSVRELDYLFKTFIEFDGNTDKFKEFLNKKIKEDREKFEENKKKSENKAKEEALAKEQDYEDNEKWQQEQDKEAK